MAFHIRNCVGTRDDRSFAVQWLACALPCRRFAGALADVCARLGADVDRYSFTVRGLHPLLLAGLPAHSENLHNFANRSMPFSHSRSWQPLLGSLGRTRAAFTDLRLFARVILEGGMELKISRRQVTIGGVTLLAGTSMGTSGQAQRDRPLKRAIEDVEK